MRTRESKNIAKEEESKNIVPVLGSLVGPLLKVITGEQMTEGKKYVVVEPEVYEMLLITTETPVNPIESTIKQIQESLNTVWNRVRISEVEKVQFHTEELNKLRRAKDERNGTAQPLQKTSIDKVKEKIIIFETTFYTELTCSTEVTWTVGTESPEITFKVYFVERTSTNDL